MSFSQKILFDNELDLTFTPGEVEVKNSKLQLALSVMNNTVLADMSNDTGFTYDPTKAEFLLGVLQQVDQSPLDSILANTFNQFDLNWHKIGGSIMGNLNGSPTIESNGLLCSGAEGVYYNVTNDTIKTIRIRYTPNYSGAPATEVNIFGVQEASGINNRVVVSHSPTNDNFRLTINDNVGASIFNNQVISGNNVNLVAGTEYILEINIASNSGRVTFYIDDTRVGNFNTAGWIFGVTPVRLYVGAMPTLLNTSDATFEDLLYFNQLVHVAPTISSAYTVPPFIYAASQVDIPQFAHSGPGTVLGIVSFLATVVREPRFTLSVDSGPHLYWNGSAFINSNETYLQASTASEFETNLPLLNVKGALTGDFKIYFPDSNDISSIDILSVTYSVNGDYPLTNPRVTVNSTINTDGVLSFIADLDENSFDEIRFAFIVDGVEKYYDSISDSWIANSSLYDKANTIDDLTNNVFTKLSVTNNLKLVLYLHSDDGSSTPTITSATITFNFDAPDITDLIETIDVFSYELYSNNEVQVGAKVFAYPLEDSYYEGENANITIERVPTNDSEALVDSEDGSWEISLIPSKFLKRFSDNTTNVPYLFERIAPNGKKTFLIAYVDGIDRVKLEELKRG